MSNPSANNYQESGHARLAFRVDDFCRAIGICRSNFYNLLKAGEIRTVVIGGRRLVPATEVERLLSSQVRLHTKNS
jgi:excisionase family DNA binding protein